MTTFTKINAAAEELNGKADALSKGIVSAVYGAIDYATSEMDGSDTACMMALENILGGVTDEAVVAWFAARGVEAF
jgi:hypothetical protein